MRLELNLNGRRLVSPLGAGLVLAAIVLALLLPTGFSRAEENPAKTLYERMGGYDALSGIVEDLLSQLHEDPAFSRFGGGRSEASQARTKQLIKDQFCWLADGPCAYIGRDMKTSHTGLGITQAEFDSMMQKLRASLEKSKIGEPEQKEFLALIEKTRGDIVEKPKDEQPKAQN